MKWVRLVRVRKKRKTQTQNPPRETTTRRVACGVSDVVAFSIWVVVGGGGRGNPGRGGDRACLREFGMGGCLAVPLTKWRIPNGGGFLKKRAPKGVWVWGLDTLRGGVRGADLNSRLFSCTFVLLTICAHLRSCVGEWVRVWICGGTRNERGGVGRVCGS